MLIPGSRMGPPPRSFAADAHDCIMVRSLSMDLPNTSLRRDDPRPKAGSPLIVIPISTKRAVVLGAVKVWPGKLGACRKVGATANLDSSCARRRQRTVGRDEETGFEIEQKKPERTKDLPLWRTP